LKKERISGILEEFLQGYRFGWGGRSYPVGYAFLGLNNGIRTDYPFGAESRGFLPENLAGQP
jgi:hypothetical protein